MNLIQDARWELRATSLVMLIQRKRATECRVVNLAHIQESRQQIAAPFALSRKVQPATVVAEIVGVKARRLTCLIGRQAADFRPTATTNLRGASCGESDSLRMRYRAWHLLVRN